VDPSRFDALVRSVASAVPSRRGLLRAVASAALGGFAAGTGRARAATRVGVCHLTGSATNPYRYVEVAASAAASHAAHGDAVDVDLQTDPANCGACGVACEGGQCAGGECVPAGPCDGVPEGTSCSVGGTNGRCRDGACCFFAGATCTDGDECCGGTCDGNGHCCATAGVACDGHGDCCGHFCRDGTCCNAAGHQCTDGTGCCGGSCVNGGCCAGVGASCASTSDCCLPGQNVCTDDGTCQPSA
jgi:hypothetical protein